MDWREAQRTGGPTFRFAPSPNGHLHLGNAYSALLNDRLARQAGGRFLLRFEDIDEERCGTAYESVIEADLSWLGLAWETPVRRQSARFADYGIMLDSLVGRSLAYPCFCTRGMIREATRGTRVTDPDGAPLYPGTCRSLSAAERCRRLASPGKRDWRLDMTAALRAVDAPLDWEEIDPDSGASRRIAAEPAAWGDAVIARNATPASYHLCVVVDDADQGVTDVVRGHDLLPATSLHRLLQQLLDLPAPRYRHHRLILDEAGHKLSKSRGAPSLRDLRHAGIEAATVKRRLGF
ncbi:MAG TPA: tRNA glutamyl-Q(34) synthetase GluQRS [Lichenihabitans sp.]|nr:tRNA glutamyl-Q(34) synthetase GluQRS [Lichenihabitans sp.]